MANAVEPVIVTSRKRTVSLILEEGEEGKGVDGVDCNSYSVGQCPTDQGCWVGGK